MIRKGESDIFIMVDIGNRVIFDITGCNISKISPRVTWLTCFDLPRPNSIDLGQFGRDRKRLAEVFLGKNDPEEFKFTLAKSNYLDLRPSNCN